MRLRPAELKSVEVRPKKKGIFFVALKISIRYGFFVCKDYCKMKCFYIVFIV